MPRFVAVPAIAEEDLILPLAGADGIVRDYTVKAKTARETIRMQTVALSQRVGYGQLTQADRELLEEFGSEGVMAGFAIPLGAQTVADMVRDGVSGFDLRRAATTALYWQIGDETTAELVWGKAPSPTTNPTPTLNDEAGSDDPTPPPGDLNGSTSSDETADEAPRTPSPDSSSGTNPAPAKTPKRRGSHGKTSGTSST